MKIAHSSRISRRLILSAGLVGLAQTVFAKTSFRMVRPRPRPAARGTPALRAVQDLVAAAGLGGEVSFAAADLRTGETLAARAPQLALPPASVTKTITSLYAIDALGPEHKFYTQLISSGELKDGTLHGDLILAGGGDPTLDTDALAALLEGLRAKGVRKVAGKFLVYGGALPFVERIDPSQQEQVGFDPAISGLNLNFNRVHFEWKRSGRGYAVTLDAPGRRYRPKVGVVRMKIVDRAYPIYTYERDGAHEIWSVARHALGRRGGRWLPVRQPALFAGDVFRALAREQGIALAQAEEVAALPDGEALARWASDDLLTILRYMLKYSTNLTAEVLGLNATKARGEQAASLHASAARMTAWLKATYGTEQANFVDHSGLEARSRISPEDMVRTLIAAAGGPLRSILKPIVMLDDKGRIDKKPPVEVVAKSGTLNFVSNLAGYATAPSGRDFVFAIFSADLPRKEALRSDQSVHPRGMHRWVTHARRLQQQLIKRWALRLRT